MRDFLGRLIGQLAKAVATEEIPASERASQREHAGQLYHDETEREGFSRRRNRARTLWPSGETEREDLRVFKKKPTLLPRSTHAATGSG